MYEIAALCTAAVIMAVMYSNTRYPKAYAFANIMSGALSLVASEMIYGGGLGGITPYNAALSVILGVPGTIAHRLMEMM